MREVCLLVEYIRMLFDLVSLTHQLSANYRLNEYELDTEAEFFGTFYEQRNSISVLCRNSAIIINKIITCNRKESNLFPTPRKPQRAYR